MVIGIIGTTCNYFSSARKSCVFATQDFSSFIFMVARLISWLHQLYTNTSVSKVKKVCKQVRDQRNGAQLLLEN